MSHTLTIWRARRAFSILELAVVLGIIALIAGAGINMAAGALKAADRVTTQERLNTIKLALDSFAKTYGYLPCPADRTLTATSANFGVESRSAATCTAIAGVMLNGSVWLGALPVRTLGLPDNYAWDAWNGKLTYATSSLLITNPTAMSTQGGAIILRDGNRTTSNIVSSTRSSTTYTGSANGTGNVIRLTGLSNTAGITAGSTTVALTGSTAPYKASYTVSALSTNTWIELSGTTWAATDAGTITWQIPGAGTAYTVVSHGPDGRGAFAANGSAIPASKPCSATAIDGENCNNDAIFFDTAYNDGSQDTLYFDDYIVYGSNDALRAPVNLSLYTNNITTTCPAGTCEAWCAACTSNYPGGGAAAPPASLAANAFLCRKIITSNATTCAASCFWGGIEGANYVKCP